jgi:hypothetical protein
MWHAWERREKCTRFWWESQKERGDGGPRHRWEDGIGMDLREIGWGGAVEWIRLAQDGDWWRVVANAVINLWGTTAMELIVIITITSKCCCASLL